MRWKIFGFLMLGLWSVFSASAGQLYKATCTDGNDISVTFDMFPRHGRTTQVGGAISVFAKTDLRVLVQTKLVQTVAGKICAQIFGKQSNDSSINASAVCIDPVGKAILFQTRDASGKANMKTFCPATVDDSVIAD